MVFIWTHYEEWIEIIPLPFRHLMLQVVASLQPCEVLGLLQVSLDDPLAAAVVPSEHHSLLQELRVDLHDVRHLVVADVQHQQLHELTLGLDLGR